MNPTSHFTNGSNSVPALELSICRMFSGSYFSPFHVCLTINQFLTHHTALRPRSFGLCKVTAHHSPQLITLLWPTRLLAVEHCLTPRLSHLLFALPWTLSSPEDTSVNVCAFITCWSFSCPLCLKCHLLRGPFLATLIKVESLLFFCKLFIFFYLLQFVFLVCLLFCSPPVLIILGQAFVL